MAFIEVRLGREERGEENIKSIEDRRRKRRKGKRRRQRKRESEVEQSTRESTRKPYVINAHLIRRDLIN